MRLSFILLQVIWEIEIDNQKKLINWGDVGQQLCGTVEATKSPKVSLLNEFHKV